MTFNKSYQTQVFTVNAIHCWPQYHCEDCHKNN